MKDKEVTGQGDTILVELTAEVVAAYVANNSVTTAALPGLISDIYEALGQAKRGSEMKERPVPAVDPKKSVKNDHIICLEDGKKFVSLKRHLMSHYGLTPQQYREKWDLPASYPMVAPSYSARRSNLAKKIGLGRKRKSG